MDQSDRLRCSCDECGELITYSPEQTGQIIACPKCGFKSELPAAVASEVVADSYSSAEFDTARPRTCPVCGDRLGRHAGACSFCETRRRRKQARLLRAVAGAVGLLVVSAVLLKVRWQPRKPAVPAFPPDGTWLPQPRVTTPKSLNDLKAGTFSLRRDGGGDVALISGDIANVSGNQHREIVVTLELLDAHGAKIGTVAETLNVLPANGVWHVISRTAQTKATTVRLGGLQTGF